MTVDLSLAIAANFRAYGKPATYAPAVGAPVAVTAIVARGAIESPSIGRAGYRLAAADQASSRIADVRRSDMPTPKAGETLTIDGQTFPIKGQPLLDDEGLVWRCILGEAS